MSWSKPKLSLALAIALLVSLPTPADALAGRIVATSGWGTVVAISPSTGVERRLFRISEGHIADIAASRDGRRIAVAVVLPPWRTPGRKGFVRLEQLWTMRGDGGGAHVVETFRRRIRPGSGASLPPIETLDSSRDGSLLLIGRRDSAAVLVRADGTRVRRIDPAGFEFGFGPEYHSGGPELTPDGRRVLSVFYSTDSRSARRRGIGVVSLRPGAAIRFLRIGAVRTGPASGHSPTLSPDGRLLAFVASTRRRGARGDRLFVMRRDSGRAHPLRGGLPPAWHLANPSFSPSGAALVLTAESGGANGPEREVGVDPTIVATVSRHGARPRILDVDRQTWWTREADWVR